MKEQVLKALATKFSGVSDNVLDRIATKIAKTITSEDQIATSVEGVTFQSIIDSYADYRATEAQQTAIHNYEKKHGLKDGKAIGGEPQAKNEPNPQPPINQNVKEDDTPEWAKSIIEQNRQLTERLNSMEGQTRTQSRKQKLNKVIERLPEYLRKPYERMPLESYEDKDFDELITSVSNEVEQVSSELSQRGSVFGTPYANTGNSKDVTEKEIDDVVSKMKI